MIMIILLLRVTKAYRQILRTYSEFESPATTSNNKSTHSCKRARGLEETDDLWLGDETLSVLYDDASPRDKLRRKEFR